MKALLRLLLGTAGMLYISLAIPALGMDALLLATCETRQALLYGEDHFLFFSKPDDIYQYLTKYITD
jgi:hypothetical protein